MVNDFLRKAVLGGWDWLGSPRVKLYIEKSHCSWPQMPAEIMLMDPKAWQAVGKTMGWEKGRPFKQSVPARTGPVRKDGTRSSYPSVIRMQRTAPRPNQWRKEWHRMIDALAEGKTIEEYLETL